MVIGDILVHNANSYGKRIALVDEQGTKLTWQELNQRVNSLANGLVALGLAKGSRIAIISENCPQYLEVLFAAAKTGLVAVTLNYRLTGTQLAFMLNDSTPEIVIVQSKFVEAINAVRAELKSVRHIIGIGSDHGCDVDYETLVKSRQSSEPEATIAESDPYSLMYTSGSTGVPRGVARSHKNALSVLLAQSLAAGYTYRDVALIGVPYFAWGGHHCILTPALSGATMGVHVFSAQSWVQMVEREKVTATFLTPTRFQMIRDYLEQTQREYDFSSLRVIGIGGQAATGEELAEMLGFFRVSWSFKEYGGTEGGGTILGPEDVARALSPDATAQEKARLSSVGKAMLGCRLKVVDENGRDLKAGEIGDILLGGDAVVIGYWNRPEATQEAFTGEWFRPGDVGRLDEDGYLYFVERKGYMVKTGGFNVFPAEVENVISQHPAVAEVAMFGIPHEKWGQAITVAVILKKGHAADEDEMKGYCRQYLAGFQVPKKVYFVDELPRHSGGTGRVFVPELIRMFSPAN